MVFEDYSKVFLVGVIEGCNIWCVNLNKVLDVLELLKVKLGECLWIVLSCLLLYILFDLEVEV